MFLVAIEKINFRHVPIYTAHPHAYMLNNCSPPIPGLQRTHYHPLPVIISPYLDLQRDGRDPTGDHVAPWRRPWLLRWLMLGGNCAILPRWPVMGCNKYLQIKGWLIYHCTWLSGQPIIYYAKPQGGRKIILCNNNQLTVFKALFFKKYTGTVCRCFNVTAAISGAASEDKTSFKTPTYISTCNYSG